MTEAANNARRHLLAPRTGRTCPRAIKKPNRWPVLLTRAGRDKVERGQWAFNQTTRPKGDRLAGRPYRQQAHGPPNR
ncbi:hypothetical protein [Streptomyces hoynatensis]|uniref:hypothetical protein n=1 Tax=Streptomyces hoynatensis TaxID=1141874 RepID=UPI001F4D3FBC|nr:hypothetical protein [Streptomyces hoynatensis]